MQQELQDRKGEGQTLNNLGNVFENWVSLTRLWSITRSLLGVAKKVGDVRTQGQTLNNLGIVYYDQGQLTKAEQVLEKALEIKKKTGDARGEGLTLMNLGNVFKERGQYPKAQGCCGILGDREENEGCAHSGNIFNNLGEVFDSRLNTRRPWSTPRNPGN